MANPSKKHWNAIKWISIYLDDTHDRGIVFDKNGASNVTMDYMDYDYVEDLDTKRSMKGYVFTFNGGCISWKSNLCMIQLHCLWKKYMVMT